MKTLGQEPDSLLVQKRAAGKRILKRAGAAGAGTKRLSLDHQVRLTTNLLEAVGKSLACSVPMMNMPVVTGDIRRQVAGRLCEMRKNTERKEPVLPKPGQQNGDLPSRGKIQGMDNLLLRMAVAVAGPWKITGFTPGSGVSIHRANCPNLKNAPAERLVEATWDRESQLSYPVEIAVRAIDRPSLLADVVAQLSESKVNIMAVDGKADRGRAALIHLTLAIQDRTQLQRIMNQLKRVKDVLSVKRRLAGRQDRQ